MITLGASFKTDSNSPCSLVKKETLSINKKHLSKTEDLCSCDYLALKVKKIAFSGLPECLFKSELKSIHFDNVAMDAFPKEVLSMPKLQSLTIKHSEVEALPEELSALKSLRYLDLRGTSVIDLPAGLEHIKRIDMRNIDINAEQQEALRAQYPETQIFFSSPCNCN